MLVQFRSWFMLAKISKFCVGILWTGKPPKKPFRLFRWLFWALGKVLTKPCDKNCLKCEKNYLMKLWKGKKKKRWNCFFLRFNEMYTCTLKQIATGYTCLSHMIMGNSRSKYSPFQRLKPFWDKIVTLLTAFLCNGIAVTRGSGRSTKLAMPTFAQDQH